MDEVSRQAVRILRLFGDTETKRVTAQVGPEQEYFLIDEKDFAKRIDLRMCGRTLFGASAPKGQELEDHYFGAIRPRVAAYMQDLDGSCGSWGSCPRPSTTRWPPASMRWPPSTPTPTPPATTTRSPWTLMRRWPGSTAWCACSMRSPLPASTARASTTTGPWLPTSGDNLFKPGSTPQPERPLPAVPGRLCEGGGRVSGLPARHRGLRGQRPPPGRPGGPSPPWCPSSWATSSPPWWSPSSTAPSTPTPARSPCGWGWT